MPGSAPAHSMDAKLSGAAGSGDASQTNTFFIPGKFKLVRQLGLFWTFNFFRSNSKKCPIGEEETRTLNLIPSYTHCVSQRVQLVLPPTANWVNVNVGIAGALYFILYVMPQGHYLGHHIKHNCRHHPIKGEWWSSLN